MTALMQPVQRCSHRLTLDLESESYTAMVSCRRCNQNPSQKDLRRLSALNQLFFD